MYAIWQNVIDLIFFPSVSSEEEEIRKRDYGVSPITPRSAAQLRLRFLSRVGQQVSVKFRGGSYMNKRGMLNGTCEFNP